MRLTDRRHKPVVSDFSRERITATGLHGKSGEGIVALKSGNADEAKALWLVIVNVNVNTVEVFVPCLVMCTTASHWSKFCQPIHFAGSCPECTYYDHWSH